MDTQPQSIFENQLIVSLICLFAGSILTIIITKIQNKIGVLSYSSRTDRIALSGEDPIFGAVNVSWQEHAVRNLFLSVLEIENTTSRDYENIKFKVYVGNDTILLGERSSVVSTPYIVEWSEEYRAIVHVPEGQRPTDAQVNRYNHDREYIVPVFNRGQKLQFTYLCTRPNDDESPGVWVDTQKTGVKLKYQKNQNYILKVPVNIAIVRGLIISVLIVCLSGIYISNVWVASSLSMFVGLSAQIFGALEYKVEQYFRNAITN